MNEDWIANAVKSLAVGDGADVFAEKPDTTEITALLMPEGQLRSVPAEELRQFSENQRRWFCQEQGIYQIVTDELVEWLRGEIGDVKAIEIGAGNGLLAERLGIVATDSYMQADPKIAAHYGMIGAATVPYGKHVLKQDAKRAMQIHKPHTILGCWVTHKYDPRQHHRGGNEFGIDEAAIVRRVKKYIVVGNAQTHRHKQILDLPHREHQFDWLYSRAQHNELNRIWVWEK